jgi:hypothetical protein
MLWREEEMNANKIIPGVNEMFELGQAKIVFIVSIGFTAVQAFMDKYVFDHSGWVKIIALAIVIDTITGVAKSYKMSTFSSYKFGSVMTKTCVYGLFILLLGGLYQVESEMTKSFATLGYSAILFREVLSVVENCEIIHPGLFPKWFIKRLAQFDEEGKFVE